MSVVSGERGGGETITQPTENWQKHYARERIIISSSSQLNKKAEHTTPSQKNLCSYST